MVYEPIVRFGFFFSIFVLMVLWEMVAPCRKLSASRRLHWFSNVGILVVGTLLLRAVFPLAAVGVAVIAQEQGMGLLPVIPLTDWQAVVLSIMALDLAVYLHHVLFHYLPTLWSLHKVHHADLDFDVTTGLRFHPLEILLSMLGKVAVVLLLGTPPLAVLIFEVLLNATSMFNHGNVRLPTQLDRLLRLFVVTPDMHRIHHSAIPQETNRNYGFNLPWWDYIFGTYRDHPSVSHTKMTIGLSEYQQDLRVEQLHWMLILPFLKHLRRSS
jgi:sterol desaturase/sphingolipid hydroxylase (fatty acid hydroxylase superfamily)